MGQRTNVGGGQAQVRPKGSFRAEKEHVPFPMQPVDGEITGLYDFEPGGPVNFYSDEQENEQEDENEQEPHEHMPAPAPTPAIPAPSPALPAPKPKPAAEAEAEADAKASAGAPALYVDLSLYIASGVLLIFMMEQFIQIGCRMRASPM
jgi:hypothetical protein